MKHLFDAYRLKTPLSENLFKRAKKVMPGGISHNIHYFPPYPIFIKKTKGFLLVSLLALYFTSKSLKSINQILIFS